MPRVRVGPLAGRDQAPSSQHPSQYCTDCHRTFKTQAGLTLHRRKCAAKLQRHLRMARGRRPAGQVSTTTTDSDVSLSNDGNTVDDTMTRLPTTPSLRTGQSEDNATLAVPVDESHANIELELVFNSAGDAEAIMEDIEGFEGVNLPVNAMLVESTAGDERGDSESVARETSSSADEFDSDNSSPSGLGVTPRSALLVGGAGTRMELETEPQAEESDLMPDDAPDLVQEGDYFRVYHSGLTARPCDQYGTFLPVGSPYIPPAASDMPSIDDWSPYSNRLQFQVADFLFRKNQMSKGQIDELMRIWGDSGSGSPPPFVDADHLYRTIDATELGHVPWQSFTITYSGPLPEDSEPEKWMLDSYEVHFQDPREVVRDMLQNSDFDGEFDFVPYREYSRSKERRWRDFFSADWAWNQADIICQNEENNGNMFVPIILGNDKTTVSVATGQNEFYPVYISIGNVRNNVRRAHRNAVAAIAFLAIPKTSKRYQASENFRRFRRQLTHSSFSHILASLKPGMSAPEVTRCPDGHYRRVLYGIGCVICDYPDQVAHACIVQGWCPKCTARPDELEEFESETAFPRQSYHTELLVDTLPLHELWKEYGIVGDIVPFTNDFPRADIYELLSPDLLHQLIKGTFKDHLVTWICEYIEKEHGKTKAAAVLDEIDRRIAAVPTFSRLRRFPEGRGFKQWTGDDSKALMKVYLPAISGLVPRKMVRALRAFLDFCYIVRRSVLDVSSLRDAEAALRSFHSEREIFRERGSRRRLGFALPRQHSLVHYVEGIRLFGAPNGLCSSITESMHIRAVKEPWRRSNKFKALVQMLIVLLRLSKLVKARRDFTARGMIDGSESQLGLGIQENQQVGVGATYHVLEDNEVPEDVDQVPARGVQDDSDKDAAGLEGVIDDRRADAVVIMSRNRQRKYPKELGGLATKQGASSLVPLCGRFLQDQLILRTAGSASGSESDHDAGQAYPDTAYCNVSVFFSATAIFHAPSDPSGIGGMRSEILRATPSWRGGRGRFDCVFVVLDEEADGFLGLAVARLLILFSFGYDGVEYPCAFVQWFCRERDEPDEDTGMWIVEKEFYEDGSPRLAVIHLETILRAAHLIPVYGGEYVDEDLEHTDTLFRFDRFYVNKFVDHHANEIAF